MLWSLNIVHRNEFVTPDLAFCVDIVLEGSQVCLIIFRVLYC